MDLAKPRGNTQQQFTAEQRLRLQQQSSQKTFKIADMNIVQDLLKEMEKLAQLEEKKTLQNQNRRRRKRSSRTMNKTQ